MCVFARARVRVCALVPVCRGGCVGMCLWRGVMVYDVYVYSECANVCVGVCVPLCLCILCVCEVGCVCMCV